MQKYHCEDRLRDFGKAGFAATEANHGRDYAKTIVGKKSGAFWALYRRLESEGRINAS